MVVNTNVKKCYEVHGGDCQRKVSPPLYFCGVDHRSSPSASSILGFTPTTLPSLIQDVDDEESLLWQAQDERASSEQLRKIRSAKIDSWVFSKTLSSHPNCPSDVLESIYHQWRENSEDIESCILAHPNTPLEILSQSFPPRSSDVAASLASNINCPEKLLERLYDRFHDDQKVVVALLNNANLSNNFVKKIWAEEEEKKALRLSENLSKPSRSYFQFEEIKKEIPISTDMSEEDLGKLIKSVDEADDSFWINAIQLGCMKRIDSSLVLKAFNKYKASSTSRQEVVGVVKALLLATYQDDEWVHLATAL